MASVEGSKFIILLLGKNFSESSRVGNFILGVKVFNTEDPPLSVKPQRIKGRVEGRIVTIFHTPHLYNPQLSQEELTQTINQSISLSGPRVFLLAIQSHSFTEEDRKRLRFILNSFSDQAINYSIVITAGPEVNKGYGRKYNAFAKLMDECHGRHHNFTQLQKYSKNSVGHLFEKIDQMFTCGTSEDIQKESVLPIDCITHQKQDELAVKGQEPVLAPQPQFHAHDDSSASFQPDNIDVKVFDPSKNIHIPFTLKSTDTTDMLSEKYLQMRPELVGKLNLAYNGKPVPRQKTLRELGVKPGAVFITFQRCVS